jgi:putative ABC transport system permease protein
LPIFRRVWLYISRKRGRSLLLLLIMFASAFFAMLGLAVKASADKAADDLRRSLCSSFVVRLNYDDTTLWKTETNEYGASFSIYSGPPVNIEMIQKVMEMDCIKDYFTTKESSLWFDLILHPGLNIKMYQDFLKDPDGVPDSMKKFGMTLDWYKVQTQTTKLYGCNDSGLHEFFRTGALTLKEGRHIRPDDRYTAVISSDVAERNGLSVGDTMTAEARDGIYVMNGDPEEAWGDPVTLEIAGIFDINFEENLSEYNEIESVYPENAIFSDLYSATQIGAVISKNMGTPDNSTNFESVTFFVDDPKNLDAAIAQTRASFDPAYYLISPDDAAYKSSAKPLNQLGALSTVLIVTVVLGCFVLLSLTLNMWGKSRKREMGILLSLGIRKKSIALQLLLESLALAVAALSLACILSGALAGGFGQAAEKMVSPKETGEKYTADRDMFFRPVISKVSADPVDLDYALTSYNIVIVALVQLGSAAAGVLVTSININRLKPKNVL